MNFFSSSMYKKLQSEEAIKTMFLIINKKECTDFNEAKNDLESFDISLNLAHLILNLTYILISYDIDMIFKPKRALNSFLSHPKTSQEELINMCCLNNNADKEVKEYILNDCFKLFGRTNQTLICMAKNPLTGFQVEALIKLVMLIFGYNDINYHFYDYAKQIDYAEKVLKDKNPKWIKCEEDLILIFDMVTNLKIRRTIYQFNQEIKLLYGIFKDNEIEYSYDGIIKFLKGENK